MLETAAGSNPAHVLRTASTLLLGLAILACRPLTPSAAVPPGTPPPTPTGAATADLAERLQAVLDKALTTFKVPGIAAAIISADHGTWVGAAGTADGTSPLDPAAQFGIGSVTKTVVAAAVLRLVEAGTVDLDRPIAGYLGDASIPTNGATVRQVLGMRSGIADYEPALEDWCADLARSVSMADLRGTLSDEALFEPGSRFRYTNANYVLAGLLVERVTGTTLAQALRTGVLAHPGLERLVYQDEERPTAPVAGPFAVRPGAEPVPGPPELLQLGGGFLPARCLASGAGPTGGMASDAVTLARWGTLLYGGEAIGSAVLAEMLTFVDGYGLAAHDHEAAFGVRAVGHEGSVPGYVTQLLAFPDEQLAIAVLVNTNDLLETNLTRLAGDLRSSLGR